MDDRQLLEAAARAAGYECAWSDSRQGFYFGLGTHTPQVWNPLDNDGDALRLAIKLRISVIFDGGVRAEHGDDSVGYLTTSSISADTRRAIVRAAAALSGVKE